jgi:hypothetical protein
MAAIKKHAGNVSLVEWDSFNRNYRSHDVHNCLDSQGVIPGEPAAVATLARRDFFNFSHIDPLR